MRLMPPHTYITMFARIAVHLSQAPSHVSGRCRTCATADTSELSHSQPEPSMMSPPSAAKHKWTFLTVPLFAAGSRGLSLDAVLAFVWLPLVQLGVKMMKGTLLGNMRVRCWFHQAQISSPTMSCKFISFIEVRHFFVISVFKQTTCGSKRTFHVYYLIITR